MKNDHVPEFQAIQPAEWAPHQSVWLAWPTHADLWQENLEAAQIEFTALCRAIADVDPQSTQARGESLNILAFDAAAERTAARALQGLPVRFHRIPFGDIWLRDTAPIFVARADGRIESHRFGFNGWGGKYALPYDAEVSARVAQAADLPGRAFSWILEGGSIEVDGQGTALTSRQCLLNTNRNPGMNQAQIEAALGESLGIAKVLWLGDGLLNDHTDGHIDTIARFTAPGVVMCMKAADAADPNFEIMNQIEADLRSFTDARGRRLEVVTVPSPGELLNADGEVMPASYLNFYIGNTTVVVPTYAQSADAEAVAQIAGAFPGRRTVGLSARAILSGGGAFHCITQQQPMPQSPRLQPPVTQGARS